MKEAIGTSMVFNLMMIFIGVMIALLIGSVSYSKGFKVRNRIMDRIEENNGFNEPAENAIYEDLKALGYRITQGNNCEDKTGINVELLTQDNFSNEYNYCVYEYTTNKGKYYGVTVFITVDIPLIGNYINIPLYGETEIIFEKGRVNG